ncbi:MAG: metal ABC transporter permease [Spirochaetota bacterium]
MAGVLIVFALLLSPAMIALSLPIKYPLIVAWIAGTIINIIAICLSYTFDLPTGYTLVTVHTIAAMGVNIFGLKI